MPILQKAVHGKFDEEMVPLLEELNKAGIKTIASCAGHGKKMAYIAIDLNSIRHLDISNNCLVLRFNWKNTFAR